VYYLILQTRLGFTDETLFGGMNKSGGGGGGGGNEVQAVVAEPVKEKEVFDIKLTVVDPKSKIKIIKEVRALTGLGLKEVMCIKQVYSCSTFSS
jgi:large subunit ribosomal protein L7/L12